MNEVQILGLILITVAVIGYFNLYVWTRRDK